MTEKVSAFIESARTRARAIKARHEELGSSLTLAQAYELLAAAEGHRTWAAMRAAGESAVEPAAAADIYEDETGWLFTVLMVRRIAPDAYDAQEEFDVPALLKAAHADLSYVFMDGEEHPAMRFRETQMIGMEEYSVTVDIEGSNLKDLQWHFERLKLAENVVSFNYGHYPSEGACSDAVFQGSSTSEKGRRWPEDPASYSAR